MKLEVIMDIHEHHPVFASWWQSRGVAVIPAELLPRLGIMAVEDGSPVAAVWLYMDNSIPLGFLNWFVTRPGLSPRKSKEALDHMIHFLKQEASRLGIKALFSGCETGSGLSRLLDRHGFALAGKGISHHYLTL